MGDTLMPPSSGSRREVLAMAWPIWISMISVTIKGVADMIMVGQLGADSLAGVGLGGVLAFNGLCFCMGVIRGQKSLVSQHLGAGEKKQAFSFGLHAFWLSIVFAVLLAVLAGVAKPLFALIAGPANMSDGATSAGEDYFAMRLLWSGAMLTALAVAEYQRGIGRTRLPMAADLISQPLNIFFNWILIFGNLGLPAMGVEGAAFGTGLSDLVSLVLLVLFSRRPYRKEELAFSWQKIRRVWSVGFASGVQFTLEVGAYTMITWCIAFLGTASMAAHHAAINILHFAFMSMVAIGDAGSVLIGKYVGAMKWKTVDRVFQSMMAIMYPVVFVIGGVLFIFGDSIIGLYVRDASEAGNAEVIRLGSTLLKVALVWQLGDALQVAYRFSLRAAGDHTWVMWAGILTAWLLTAPLAAGAVFLLKGTVVTVWWVWTVEIFFGAWLFRRRWKSGHWKNKRLVEDGQTVLADPAVQPPA